VVKEVAGENGMPTEDEWREVLSPDQFQVLRQKGTERAFAGEYWDTKDVGIYQCGGCGSPLFDSESKFDSGTGWPSFFEPIEAERITEHSDTTLGMERTEVTCSHCGGHLGHVFPDGPEPTGLRFCLNSISLKFAPKAS
jgi:peptide-methionine (R)-S-oxide reductase